MKYLREETKDVGKGTEEILMGILISIPEGSEAVQFMKDIRP